ncbi:hypothetical protein BDV36DRAFT_304068 [Aspergillus pseudocaelatus]|uniref:MACPF domain-containing protein n=1 Tax=Aspergillus pseudocaelatus TaxID=1825620 RepID=A0ABQ6W8Q8_9EURO|nr:hypothetical protein BDV36DRAFT_304068 [Aspergillus pseudocaelatus]
MAGLFKGIHGVIQDKTGVAAGAAQEAVTAVGEIPKEILDIIADDKKEPQQILHVYSYSRESKLIKEKCCLPFKNVKEEEMQLTDIRKLLIGENIVEPRLVWSSFCNQRGAIVQDITNFKAYLQILNEKEISQDNADTYRVYLLSEKIINQDVINKAILDRGEKVTADKRLTELPTASQPEPIQAPTSFSHNIFINPTTTFSIVHPADMSEKQWSVVVRNNSLLNPYRVVDLGKKGGKIVERSIHSAFVLKPRAFQDYQISASGAKTSVNAQQMLRIPFFRIEDDSYIEQFEENKSVSRAVAASSMSQFDASLAIEGGAFGFSASASASYGEKNSSSDSSSSSEETRVMNITYNFPRVIIDFDHQSLDLSNQCKADLKAVSTAADIESFKDKYGRLFAMRVQLGGRLHAAEESTARSSAERAEHAKSQRAAAALSFKSPYVQASANMNNPPAWTYTVGSFYNWRVVKQSSVLAIEDVISSIPGYQDTKQIFAGILDKNSKKAAPGETEQKPGIIVFQLRSKMVDKYVTIGQQATKDEVAKHISELTAGKPTTKKRLHFISNLSVSITDAAQLQFEYKKDSVNQKLRQVLALFHFYVGSRRIGLADRSNSQLKYNHPYKIYSKDGKENKLWLFSNRIMPGYMSTALVWAAKEKGATSFRFLLPSNLNNSPSRDIENGEEVSIQLFDQHDHEINLATRFDRRGDKVGTVVDLDDFAKLANDLDTTWELSYL